MWFGREVAGCRIVDHFQLADGEFELNPCLVHYFHNILDDGIFVVLSVQLIHSGC